MQYMYIHTAIYNFCVSHGTVQPSKQGLVTRGAQLLGAEIYESLSQYLKNHLTEIKNESTSYTDENLVNFYIKSWDRFIIGAKFLNNIFAYLNRYWIKREREEGRKHIQDINTLCLIHWKTDLFDQTHENLMAAVLKIIKRQRDGEAITTASIRKVVQSFVALGLDETNIRKTNLSVYVQFFEEPFIKDTRQYYANESREFLATKGVVEYLKKATVRLKEESNRVDMYLHPSSERTLNSVCERVLIAEHAAEIQNEFLPLLESDREKDINLMYTLLERIPDGLSPLQTTLRQYIKTQGLAAVDNLATQTGANPVDPQAYVDTLLQVNIKYSNLVQAAFNNHSDMVKGLDDACKEFINTNSITKPPNKTGRVLSTPELLSKYSDSLLKKSSKNVEVTNIDAALSGVMSIFQYVDEKDVFEKAYSRTLARRLVNNVSASQDAETNMVSKLKEICGSEFTNKLQRMFQDMLVSEEMQGPFKEFLDNSEIKQVGEFTPFVLAEGFWPLPTFNSTFKLPEELVPVFNKFLAFYNNKHNGRKLNWLWNFSKGELRGNFSKTSKTPYSLTVSIFQMALLLPYNDQLEYTIEQLRDITNLDNTILTNSMSVLLKARILIQSPPDAPCGADGTTYKLNTDFKSKKLRINLNVPMKSEQKKEIDDTHKAVEDDRKMFLQAVIVRIMKARKQLKHVQLVQEIMEQSRKRFNPKVSLIKKCIDDLIDREYLKRIEDNQYQYLA